MVFTTVPENRFVTDVMKTWLTFLRNIPELAGVAILPRQPDVDIDFALPTIALLRVDTENWEVTRNGWFHGWQPFDDNVLTNPTYRIAKLMWYTYKTTYQLDIYAKSLNEKNELASVINRYLKNVDWTDVFLSKGCASQTVLPLVDFATPQDTVGTATDLRIRFRYWRDVENVDKPWFDKEVHQYSIAINFWVDYLKEYEFPSIQDIVTEIETNI